MVAPEFLFTSSRGRFGCWRSSKIDKFGANRKRICDFLLVHNSNFGLILHHFGVMTTFLCSWPRPYSTLILGCSRCTRSPMLGINECMGLSYSAVKLFLKYSNLFEHGTWSVQRVRQTDGRLTVASPSSALASRGKNVKSHVFWIFQKCKKNVKKT